MKLASFSVAGQHSYGIVRHDGVVDAGRRLGAKYPTLLDVLSADALAEVLAVGADAQVVVAARPPRLGHQPQRARAGLDGHDLERRQPIRELGLARTDLLERATEPAQALGVERGRDVEPVGHLGAAVHDPGEAADHDVAEPLAVERGEQRVRVEDGLAAHRLR